MYSSRLRKIVLIVIALLWLIPTRVQITKLDAIIRYEGVLLIAVIALAIPKAAIIKKFNFKIYHHYIDKILFLLILASFIAFYANPALPTFSESSTSGFGFWFSLFLGYTWFIFVRAFIQDKDDVKVLFRALLFFSVIFAILFIYLFIVNSSEMKAELQKLGIYVTYFGNGRYRFVFLGNFALIILLAYIKPNVFGVRTKIIKIVILLLGVTALLLSGNRISIISVGSAILLTLYLSGKRGKIVIIGTATIVTFFIIINMVNIGIISVHNPLVRSLGLINKEIEDQTQASNTTKLKYEMWDMALREAIAKPFGHGFPHLSQHELEMFKTKRNTFSRYETIKYLVLIGGTHNAYFSTGYNIGIGAMFLFLFLVFSVVCTLIMNVKKNTIVDEYKDYIIIAASIALEMALHLFAGGNLTKPAMFIGLGSTLSIYLLFKKIKRNQIQSS